MSGTSPTVVAFLRGVIIAVIVAALGAAAHVLGGLDFTDIPADWRPIAAAVAGIVVRTIEGVADKVRGQAPQAPLGSAPANPNAYN